MSDLEQNAYIFASIFTLANKLYVLGNRFDRNVTVKQWLFLVCVSKFDEPPNMSEVADFVGYTRQNAMRLATALQKRGYVEIQKDRNDARAWRILLTPKCRSYFSKRGGKETEFLTKLFDGFDADQTAAVFKGLITLERNIAVMSGTELNASAGPGPTTKGV